MLEKLFSVGSFGGFINDLACCQTIFPASSGKLSLPFVIWIATLHSWDVGH